MFSNGFGKHADAGRLTRKERSTLELEGTIAELRAIPGAADMVEHLFEPILRRLQLVAPSPGYAMRTLIEWALDWGLTRAEMDEIRDGLLAGNRVAKVFPAQIEEAMGQVRKRRPKRGVLVSQETTPAQYAAWLRYGERADAEPELRTAARNLYRHGRWGMPSAWPPKKLGSGESGVGSGESRAVSETSQSEDAA